MTVCVQAERDDRRSRSGVTATPHASAASATRAVSTRPVGVRLHHEEQPRIADRHEHAIGERDHRGGRAGHRRPPHAGGFLTRAGAPRPAGRGGPRRRRTARRPRACARSRSPRASRLPGPARRSGGADALVLGPVDETPASTPAGVFLSPQAPSASAEKTSAAHATARDGDVSRPMDDRASAVPIGWRKVARHMVNPGARSETPRRRRWFRADFPRCTSGSS